MDLQTAISAAEARKKVVAEARNESAVENPEKPAKERFDELGERIVAVAGGRGLPWTRAYVNFPEHNISLHLRAQWGFYVDRSEPPSLFGAEASWFDTTIDHLTHTGTANGLISREYLSRGELNGENPNLPTLELLEASLEAAEEQISQSANSTED